MASDIWSLTNHSHFDAAVSHMNHKDLIMNIKILFSSKIIKPVTLAATFLLSTIAINAQAVFIDFDDLTFVPHHTEMPSFSDTPITDQYLSLGLAVDDGYLLPYNFFNNPDPEIDPWVISGPNYLLGGNTLNFNFVGADLPTYVGMYVGSGNGETIFLEAYGISGLLFSTHTAGDGGPYSAPYTHKQYVSFASTEGIQRIQMWGFHNGRVSAMVDDLTFTYAAVPEPSSMSLLCLGLFMLIYKRITLSRRTKVKP